MLAEKIGNYLNPLRKERGFTYEALAIASKSSESTIKKLCLGKAENPTLDIVMSVTYTLDGSLDEMLNPNAVKNIPNEDHRWYVEEINRVREHDRIHREDLERNLEHRLADKREIIAAKDDYIARIEAHSNSYKIAAWTLGSILIAVLIAEVMHPNLGWIRFDSGESVESIIKTISGIVVVGVGIALSRLLFSLLPKKSKEQTK